MAGRPRLEKHTVTGNLTADPVTRKVGESELVTFRLADTPRIFDREAKAWKDGETVYYDVAVRTPSWGETSQGPSRKETAPPSPATTKRSPTSPRSRRTGAEPPDLG